MFVDTHCHLYFEAFENDLDEIIDRCLDVNLTKLLNPGIDLSTSKAAVKLSREHQEFFAAVGVHPNDAATWDDKIANEISELLNDGKVVAVGEIGLDYYHEHSSIDFQQTVFEKQLSIATGKGLPVIIHLRDRDQDRPAFRDGLNILERWIDSLLKSNHPLANNPGVLHSFGGNCDLSQRAIDMNFYIGVTGPVTYKNAEIMQDVVASTPLEKLLIETDSPFLPPHPLRGQRNEPANVIYIVKKISEIKNIPVGTVTQVTTDNAQRLFNW